MTAVWFTSRQKGNPNCEVLGGRSRPESDGNDRRDHSGEPLSTIEFPHKAIDIPFAVRRSVAFALLMLPLVATHASPIIQRTGPILASSGGNPMAEGWTQSAAYTNVSVSVDAYNYNSNGASRAAEVFLTDSIGPGTTQLTNEIASAQIYTTIQGAQTFNVFSGLTLGPGTYNLVYLIENLASYDDLCWGITTSAISTAPGVFEVGPYATQGNPDPYAPATVMVSAPFFTQIFSVSGELQQSIPEPSTLALVAAAFAGMGCARRRMAASAQVVAPAPGGQRSALRGKTSRAPTASAKLAASHGH
jgi:hypothetical protein